MALKQGAMEAITEYLGFSEPDSQEHDPAVIIPKARGMSAFLKSRADVFAECADGAAQAALDAVASRVLSSEESPGRLARMLFAMMKIYAEGCDEKPDKVFLKVIGAMTIH